MYRISMWTSFLMELSPEDALKCLHDHGYKSAELSDEHGLVLLGRGNPSSVGKALKNYAENIGIDIAQGHLRLSADIAAPDAAERKKTLDDLKQWLELFDALNIRAAVLHPGGKEASLAGWAEDKIAEIRSKSLNTLCAFSKGSSPLICLENLSQDAAQLLSMIKSASVDNLGICLDTGHLNCYGNRKWSEFIIKAGKHLKALHIADNLGVDDNHLFPYGGRVNWKEVMTALKSVNYSGLFNFEVPGERFNCPTEVKEAKLDYALKLAQLMMNLN